MTTKTYLGSCHCGRVKFEADIDLAAGTAKCNCTFCTKARLWGVMIKPAAFRLKSGEKDLQDYQASGQGPVHHLFCRHCGVRPFERGFVKEMGGDCVSVNVACLDNLDLDELAVAPVTYMDGRNNQWMQRPNDTRTM